MKQWRCPECDRANSANRSTCVECEAGRPDSEATDRGSSLQCPVIGCGGVLEGLGKCRTAGGYPEGFGVKIAEGKWHSCPPEVCDRCRGPLEWSGKCYRCWHGGQRDRVPSNEYQLKDGHWVVTIRGSRSVAECGVPGCTMTLDEHRREGMRAIREMLEGVRP